MAGVSDVSKQVKGLVEKVTRAASNLPQNPSAGQDSIDDLSVLVQDFYQLLQKRLETKEVTNRPLIIEISLIKPKLHYSVTFDILSFQ
jgi:Domain of unknown function (DUF5601)